MATEITWVLISKDGIRQLLSPEMMFVGSQNCELTLKCKSIDKQHAVLNFDSIQNAFRIKDLSSSNGTFVNETRIPELIYITLKHGDQVRFGYGSEEFSISRIVRVRNLSQRSKSSSSLKISSNKSSASSKTLPPKSSSSTDIKQVIPAKQSTSVPSFSSNEIGKSTQTDLHHNENFSEVQKIASSQSVDNWFALNQPNRKTTKNLASKSETNEAPERQERVLESASLEVEKQEEEDLKMFQEEEDSNFAEKVIGEVKSKTSSSSSSSSSNEVSNASCTGTYTVLVEEKKNVNDEDDKDLQATKHILISDWIKNQQVTSDNHTPSNQPPSNESLSNRLSTNSKPSFAPISLQKTNSFSNPSSNKKSFRKENQKTTKDGSLKKSPDSTEDTAIDALENPSEEPVLVRSGSFTMNEPSGAVPRAEIPTIASFSALPPKMNRCNSFTKIRSETPSKIRTEKNMMTSSHRSRSSSRDRFYQPISNRQAINQKSPKNWKKSNPTTNTLSSTLERAKTSPTRQTPPKPKSRSNYSSDCEPSTLRLTRTTLLRQSKAKDRNNRSSTSTVTSSTTANLPSREKKKVVRSNSERLNQLSKPPMRRLASRQSGNESSDTEARAGVRPGRRKSAAALEGRRQTSRGRLSTSEDKDASRSLESKILRHSRYDKPHVHPGRKVNAATSVTSESENEDYDVKMYRRRHQVARSFRSPPDGEMGDQIAKMSHDVARNLSLLSSKTHDDDEPSNIDSLDITSNQDSDLEDERGRRRTWDSQVTALDSLMLSNVCALSVRLCAIADGLTGKIALLHSRSAPYDPSKSHVPLLQQTSSQEMATLVNNLRHVESQLIRADKILDPAPKLRSLLRD